MRQCLLRQCVLLLLSLSTKLAMMCGCDGCDICGRQRRRATERPTTPESPTAPAANRLLTPTVARAMREDSLRELVHATRAGSFKAQHDARGSMRDLKRGSGDNGI